MPKFIVDLHLDSYETKEELEAACEKFIFEQLNSAGSSATIYKVIEIK